MTIQQALQYLYSYYPQVDRSLIKRWCAHILGVEATNLILTVTHTCSENSFHSMKKGVQALAAGIPITRLIGYRWFWKSKFMLSPDTLDPRPDTETLIEHIMDIVPDKETTFNLCDIGIGSGALLFSLLLEYPKAYGVGIDISMGALQTARINACNMGVDDRVMLIQGSWGEALSQRADIVVSNPPYIAEKDYACLDSIVRDHDPYKALVSGETGLEGFAAIFERGFSFICFEIGYEQAQSVNQLASIRGYKYHSCRKDLGGIVRSIIYERCTY